MKATTNHRRNKGSAPTKAQVKSGASTSMGSKRSVKIKGGRGSYEGHGYAPRADIISNTQGYMSPDAQGARRRPPESPRLDHDVNTFQPSGFSNPAAISNIGMNYTGSARILKSRMELNGV